MLTFLLGFALGALLAGLAFGLVQMLFSGRERDLRAVSRLEMLDSLPEPLALSERGVFVYRNEAWRRELDRDSDVHAAPGARPVADWIARQVSQPRERLVESPSDAVERGVVRAERQLRSDDGRILQWTAVPYSGTGRRLVLHMVHDVTVWAEEPYGQAEFMNKAAHELKTPITAIKGYAELLEMYVQSGRPVKPEIARPVVEQSNRLVHLVNQLLDVARLGTGRLRNHPEAVRLDTLAEQTAAQLRERFPDRELTVEAEPLGAVLDPDRFGQVLRELILNGLQYSDGPVGLRLALDGDSVVVAVRDQGIGIPEPDLPRIGERFVRATNVTSRPLAQGFGLGLYLSRQILRLWGGDLKLESRVGEGTDAIIRFPWRPQPARHEGHEADENLAIPRLPARDGGSVNR